MGGSFCMGAVEPEFHIPFEKYKLANGLRVILSRDTTMPVTAVYVLYDVGARTEEKGQAGFAHLVERMMFDGSANVKKGEHVRYVQANGGEVNGEAHGDYTDYFEVMPANQLALALWLESDRMRRLSINEEDLKRRRETIRQEKRNYDGQTYRMAIADRWLPLIFSDVHDTRAAMASTDDLQAATVDDVRKFYRTWYAPNNAVLVISGDFVVAEAKKTVEQYFGDIPSQTLPARPATIEPARAAGKTLTVTDEQARVPAVVVGWPAPRRHSPDWYALNVLDAVLTAGRESKLEQELMKGRQSVLQVDENLGWPFSTPFDFKDPGYFAALLVGRPIFKAEELVEEYQQVIDNIVANGIDSVDLKRAKAVMTQTKAAGLQTALERAKLLGVSEAIDGDPDLVEREYTSMLAITAGQIQAAAKRYLTAERRDVMAIQPAPGAAK